jgi:Tfp pilus assembly protein PilP
VTAPRSLLLAVPVCALAACGGAPQPVPPPAAAVPAAPKTAMQPPAAPAVPEVTGPEVPKYEIKGRRDPFERLDVKESAGAGSALAAAKLTGILRSTKGIFALVETPDGIGYILKPGDTLGDGRLLEIGSDSVVFQVAPKPGATTNRVVLKLATN